MPNIQVTTEKDYEGLQADLQWLVDTFGAENIHALRHAYQTEPTTKGIVDRKMKSTAKKLNNQTKKSKGFVKLKL